MKRVLVLGATSTITARLCRLLAGRGDSLYLAGRDEDELTRQASDLRIRFGTPVRCGQVEAERFERHRDFIERAAAEMEGLDGVVFSIGLLGDQPEDSHDPNRAKQLIDVNFTAAVTLLAAAANLLEKRQNGFILGLSSVAGDRGRGSNYAYGAAKGGLSLFLQGLRNRLDGKGVRVYTAKLGVVDTAMTYGIPGLPPAADPDAVAASLLKLLGKPSGTYYVPWIWRWIMTLIRCIPEPIFKKLSL